MDKNESWIPYTCHCHNCGSIVTGYRNKNGMIKMQCKNCHFVMVWIVKERGPDTVLVFPPESPPEEY